VVNVVAAHTARVRWHSREFHIQAEVVVAAGAFEAFPAGYAGLDGDAIAYLEMGDFGAGPNDFA
jgi:hypothetical protein